MAHQAQQEVQETESDSTKIFPSFSLSGSWITRLILKTDKLSVSLASSKKKSVARDRGARVDPTLELIFGDDIQARRIGFKNGGQARIIAYIDEIVDRNR